MNKITHWKLAMGTTLAAAVVGCSGSGGKEHDPSAEKTGTIVAFLTDVPDDVQCVDISTSDYQFNPEVRTDVTPGSDKVIRISPLATGFIELSGKAYNVPCSQAPYGNYYGGYDSGLAPPTWVADYTEAQVTAGETTQVELRFHQLGSLDVNVTFDNCTSDAGSPSCAAPDSGAPPPAFDATPAGDD